MMFLEFDAFLREGKTPSNSTCIPLRYSEFATIFNTGASHRNTHQLSTFVSTPARNQITRSSTPVFLDDFHITPEQCGLAPLRSNSLTEAHAFILEDYATMQAYKNKRCREAFQDCDNRRLERDDRHRTLFERPGPARRRQQRSGRLIVDTDDEFTLGILDDPPQASTSTQPATDIPTTTSEPVINEHVAEYPALELFTNISANTYSDITPQEPDEYAHNGEDMQDWPSIVKPRRGRALKGGCNVSDVVASSRH